MEIPVGSTARCARDPRTLLPRELSALQNSTVARTGTAHDGKNPTPLDVRTFAHLSSARRPHRHPLARSWLTGNNPPARAMRLTTPSSEKTRKREPSPGRPICVGPSVADTTTNRPHIPSRHNDLKQQDKNAARHPAVSSPSLPETPAAPGQPSRPAKTPQLGPIDPFRKRKVPTKTPEPETRPKQPDHASGPSHLRRFKQHDNRFVRASPFSGSSR